MERQRALDSLDASLFTALWKPKQTLSLCSLEAYSSIPDGSRGLSNRKLVKYTLFHMSRRLLTWT